MSTALDRPKFDFNRPAKGGVPELNNMGQVILPQIASALPPLMAKHADRMLRTLLTECQKTPRLLDCSPKSLFGGVIQVAALGLELGGPAGQAYLLPFKGEATLCIGYKGFITLAHRAGVKRFTPRVVREGDEFAIRYGSNQRIDHAPRSWDGPVLGYYAIVETPGGGEDFEYMSLAEVEAHRARYALQKSGGPWANQFDEMAKKTVIRRLAKRVPLSVEWVKAAVLDELAEDGISQHLAAAVVLEGQHAADDRVNQLKGRIDPPAATTPEEDEERLLRERAEAVA